MKYRIEFDQSNAQDGSCFEEYRTIEADSPEEAAEEAAKQSDSYGDYEILGGNPALIRVTEDVEGGRSVTFKVEGEAVPNYIAYEVTP